MVDASWRPRYGAVNVNETSAVWPVATVTFWVCVPSAFVPGFEDVVARRQRADVEHPVLTGHREVGVIHDADVGVHPAVHIAP